MSQSALCLAVRDTLRDVLRLGTEPNYCDLALGGMPHPAAGQVFYAVHPGGWETINGDYDLGETMGAKITVSKKLGDTPKDRTLTAAWSTPVSGLDALARAAILAIHRNQAVRAAANAILGATDALDGTPNGFETELWFQGADPEPVPRDYEWFGAAPPSGSVAVMGISITLRFGLADRVQTIGGMT